MKAKIWQHSFFMPFIEGNEDLVVDAFNKGQAKAGFTVVGFSEKKFEPQGYSCVWLLAESHLALHTFPGDGKAWVELASCNLKKYTRHKNL